MVIKAYSTQFHRCHLFTLWGWGLLKEMGAFLSTDNKAFYEAIMSHNITGKSDSSPDTLTIPPILRVTDHYSNTVITKPIALNCLTNKTVWMDQWPIMDPNLSTLKYLVKSNFPLVLLNHPIAGPILQYLLLRKSQVNNICYKT